MNKLRPHEVNKLDQFICGFYNNDVEICDELINFHKTNSNTTSGTIFLKGESIVDKSVKDSLDVKIAYNPSPDGKFIRFTNWLQDSVNAYVEQYPQSNKYGPWSIMEPFTIQQYPLGGAFFQWHTERSSALTPNCHRHLVFMTYLNDITDGGETEFFHQKLLIKPEKGLTLIWPADWTFTHRGIPSMSQEKIIATGWFSYRH